MNNKLVLLREIICLGLLSLGMAAPRSYGKLRQVATLPRTTPEFQ
jgi:hypothetical protein